MRERRVEVFDNDFGASLQHVPECPLTSERGTDVGSHGNRNLSRVCGPHRLGLLSLGDIADESGEGALTARDDFGE
jgi:hypothetical protein